MTNGLNFGFRRTLGAILGVALGYSFLVLCGTIGLAALFKNHPVIYTVTEYISGLYMLYLAYKMAKSNSTMNTPKKSKPVSFLQAAALQWVNTKGWALVISMAVTYTPIANFPYNTIIMATICAFLGIGSASTWAGLGNFLQRFMHKPKLLRAFNIIMGLLLVASLYPLFADALK